MLRKVTGWVLVTMFAVSVLALDALGQNAGGGGGGGGGGGRQARQGRQGGQGGQGGMRNRTPQTMEERMVQLLSDPEIIQDLALTAEQQASIKAIQDQARQVMDQARQQAQPQPATPPADGSTPAAPQGGGRRGGGQRNPAMQQAMTTAREQTAELSKQMLAVLTDEQRAKLQAAAEVQVEEQARSRAVRSLTDTTVASQIGLSDEQRTQIADILQKSSDEQRQMMRDATADTANLPAAERRAKMREIAQGLSAKRNEMRAATEAAVIQILTPDQQAALGAYVQQQIKAGQGNTVTVTRRQASQGGQAPADTTAPAPTQP